MNEIVDGKLWEDIFNLQRSRFIANTHARLRRTIKERLPLSAGEKKHTWLILDLDQADPYYMKVTAKRYWDGSRITYTFASQEKADG